MATIHDLDPARHMTLDEIFAALEIPADPIGPDSIYLAPGETIHDRREHHLAKGRAANVATRRAAFKIV